jgi:tetratricopeptide (TPR) repeat protein
VAAIRTNSEAYDLYLLAKQRMYERTGPTIQSARELLDRAIALDSAYAPAYAQRAISTLLLAEGGGAYGDIPLEQARSESKLYIDKALELDPGLAEGWAALGFYYRQSRDAEDTRKAVGILEKALAMNPGLINASNWLQNALINLGRPVEARAIVMEMVQRDPLYRPGIRNAVNSYVEFGEQEQAQALLDRVRPMVPNESILRSAEATLRLSVGQIAEGVELSEAALALEASNAVTRFTYQESLENSGQYERLAGMDEGFFPVYALVLLGRTEEAMIRASRRLDEQRDVGTFFTVLNQTGRSAELIAFLEDRWPDLESLHQDYPPYASFGDFVMLDAALAYSRTANQARFEKAMSLIREYQQNMETAGVKSRYFFMASASFYALAGDLATSLNFLEQAAELGQTGPLRLARTWPWLEPLEGDPRYEAIQAQMTDHMNSERAKLGLAPSRI